LWYGGYEGREAADTSDYKGGNDLFCSKSFKEEFDYSRK